MGIQTVLVILDNIDSLIEERNFVEAQKVIRQITRDDIGSDQIALGRYCFALGKINVRTGVNDIRPIERAIKIFRTDDLAAQKYGEAVLWKGLALRNAAKFPEARQEFRNAATWFHNLENVEWEAIALDSMGYCAGQEGNVDVATAALEKAIELFRSVDRLPQARISVNGLARIYLNIGRLQEAKGILMTSPLATTDEGSRHAVHYNSNMGVTCAVLGQHQEAARYLKAAQAGAHVLPTLRAVYWQARGRLRYLEGEFESGLKAFKKGQEIAGDESDMTCGLVRRMAECCLALNQAGLAKGYADHSLRQAKANGDPWEMAASQRVLAGVAAHNGDAQTARLLFRAAIKEFERMGHEYELAITRVFAARTRLFGKEQTDEWNGWVTGYFDREGVEQKGRNPGVA